MRIKNLYILLFLALTLLISACSNNAEPKENIGEIFSVALDSIMEYDEELNTDMEFIAINLNIFDDLKDSDFDDLSESDEEEILSYFEEKYEIDVMITNDTVQELKETEVYDTDTDTLKGVFLAIDKVDLKDDKNVLFEGNKYRSNTSGYGVGFTVYYEDDEWQTSEIEELLRLMEDPTG